MIFKLIIIFIALLMLTNVARLIYISYLRKLRDRQNFKTEIGQATAKECNRIINILTGYWNLKKKN